VTSERETSRDELHASIPAGWWVGTPSSSGDRLADLCAKEGLNDSLELVVRHRETSKR